MPSLDRNVKVTCENCGVQITKLNLACHRKKSSAGTLYCPKCPNFSTTSRDDLYYHIGKKHSVPRLQKRTSVNYVTLNLPVFMLYVNLKIFNMEHKLASERTIIMWRI